MIVIKIIISKHIINVVCAYALYFSLKDSLKNKFEKRWTITTILEEERE